MAEWQAVGPEAFLADGQMTEIRLGEQRLLLARVEGRYYAVQAFCSHMGGEFVRGKLEGTVVSCPRNVSKFDVRDGSVVTWLSRMPDLLRKVIMGVQHPKSLQTYRTRIAEGQVWVEIA